MSAEMLFCVPQRLLHAQKRALTLLQLGSLSSELEPLWRGEESVFICTGRILSSTRGSAASCVEQAVTTGLIFSILLLLLYFFFSSYRCHIKPAGPRDDWKATVQLSATMDIHGWYMMLIPKAGKWSQMHYSHWFFQRTSDAINSMYRTKHISLLLNDACFAHCGKGEGNQVLRAERPSCKFCPQYFYPHHWRKMI